MNHKNMYLRLFVMIVISYLVMYALMFSMVNSFSNVIPNLNQAYMVNLMVMPMIILELVIMGSMYPNKKINILIILLSLIFMFSMWSGIRNQKGINDSEFLRSMIPHHGGAILMCSKANLKDPEVKKLCDNIIVNQNAEILQMKQILNRIENKQ